MTDLISFEPCDGNFRPLNILNTNDSEISEMVEVCQYLPMTAKSKEPNVNFNYEPEGISPEVWITYKYYLTLMMGRVEFIKTHDLGTHHKNIAYLKAMRIS